MILFQHMVLLRFVLVTQEAHAHTHQHFFFTGWTTIMDWSSVLLGYNHDKNRHLK